MNTHEVEAESVDVVFLCPIEHRLNHKLAHERFLARCLITTTRSVGNLSVGGLAVVIAGVGEIEVAVVNIEGVVIHYIEDDSYACLVEGLNHLLELLDARYGACGIGGI